MKTQAPEYADKLIEAINLQTKAIQYLADVIGYKADEKNNGKVKLDMKIDKEPPVTYTLDQIKAALNAYARKAGKDKALEFVNKFAGSNNPADIPENKYSEVMEEL